jgi:hypothetical protein
MKEVTLRDKLREALREADAWPQRGLPLIRSMRMRRLVALIRTSERAARWSCPRIAGCYLLIATT